MLARLGAFLRSDDAGRRNGRTRRVHRQGENVVITVDGLARDFEVTVRPPGLRSALRSVIRRTTRTVQAVNDVSFEVAGGQVLGVLGPNGSGKTTILKCLSGLLTPTEGMVDVLGYVPADRDPRFLRQLGFVMGQRWQLHIDLPVIDSFALNGVIYGLKPGEFRTNRDDLIEFLGLQDLLDTPARKLSLGQRMRCEFAAALIHRPPVVLLDEPTLGLDFDAQLHIRDFVRHYVDVTGACVLLTSHYLADIEALCDDVLTLSSGRVTFQGPLQTLRSMAGDDVRVRARLTRPVAPATVAHVGKVISHTSSEIVLGVRRGSSLKRSSGETMRQACRWSLRRMRPSRTTTRETT